MKNQSEKGRKISEANKRQWANGTRKYPDSFRFTTGHTEATKKKMSFAKMGSKNSFFGKTHTPEVIDKIKKAQVGRGGDKHPMWKGGISQRYRKTIAPRPQPNVCEVCGAFAGKGKAGIHYDHDHSTGKFRGWLCSRCNVALGMVKDNAETLTALAEYIKKSRIS